MEAPLIDRRYRITGRLGAGTMGVVHRAEDVFLERTVAIKLIDAPNARDAETVERFLKEARALARVKHPNVAEVYGFGPHAGSWYFAMEYVAGENVESMTVDFATAIGVARALAGGLDAVHEQGLVHRDVKPSNVVIEQATGRPVLIDFGLARRKSASSPRLSLVAGTPMYMAPE